MRGNAPQGHMADRLRRHGKRRDAALGLDAGMRRLSAEGCGERAMARCLVDDGARIAVGIQYVARRAFRQKRRIESAGAQQVHFLARGQDDMHIRKRLPCFDEAANTLEDGGHASLIVGREDGIPRAADHAVLHHGFDPLAWAHGIHMPAQRHRAGGAAGAESDQVARVGTGPFRGIIEADGEAQALQLGLAPFRHKGLTTRRAFDARKFAEQIEQAVGLHGLPFQSGCRFIGMSIHRDTRKAALRRLSEMVHI